VQFCDGGELYALLNSQPKKRLKEVRGRRPAQCPTGAAQGGLLLAGRWQRCEQVPRKKKEPVCVCFQAASEPGPTSAWTLHAAAAASQTHVRFYTAEVLLALQYLHLLGFVYRDLKVGTAGRGGGGTGGAAVVGRRRTVGPSL
jgi:serine/threonine protein kinase